MIEPRLSLVTLGVASLPAARAFYERLGWRPSAASQEEIAFYQLGSLALALFPRHLLTADAHLDTAGSGFSGVTLAHNCRSVAAVDAAYEAALAAGARALKRPETVFWGGYSGYFADPDGHVWEVAYNPFFPLTEEGALVLPPRAP